MNFLPLIMHDPAYDGFPSNPLEIHIDPSEIDGRRVVVCEIDPVFDDGEKYGRLLAASADLLSALNSLLDRYVSLVNCGDCGHWNPETEPPVIAARAAIAKTEGKS